MASGLFCKCNSLCNACLEFVLRVHLDLHLESHEYHYLYSVKGTRNALTIENENGIKVFLPCLNESIVVDGVSHRGRILEVDGWNGFPCFSAPCFVEVVQRKSFWHPAPVGRARCRGSEVRCDLGRCSFGRVKQFGTLLTLTKVVEPMTKVLTCLDPLATVCVYRVHGTIVQ